MENKDIRWKQRFQNFEKSLNHLDEAVKIKNPDTLQRAGMIQFFEMSFELSWNVMKDYVQELGFSNVRSPRDSIKKAFEIGLVTNGHDWLEFLEDRNMTSHAYDEETAKEIENLIRIKYLQLLKELHNTLKAKLNE